MRTIERDHLDIQEVRRQANRLWHFATRMVPPADTNNRHWFVQGELLDVQGQMRNVVRDYRATLGYYRGKEKRYGDWRHRAMTHALTTIRSAISKLHIAHGDPHITLAGGVVTITVAHSCLLKMEPKHIAHTIDQYIVVLLKVHEHTSDDMHQAYLADMVHLDMRGINTNGSLTLWPTRRWIAFGNSAETSPICADGKTYQSCKEEFDKKVAVKVFASINR